MNKEIKEKWVEALRSGKYKQGEGWLKRRGSKEGEFSFCCLGVLVDVDGHTWKDDHSLACQYPESKNGNLVASSSELYSEYRNKIGLTQRDAHFLIMQNDNGSSFEFIANWIEENL